MLLLRSMSSFIASSSVLSQHLAHSSAKNFEVAAAAAVAVAEAQLQPLKDPREADITGTAYLTAHHTPSVLLALATIGFISNPFSTKQKDRKKKPRADRTRLNMTPSSHDNGEEATAKARLLSIHYMTASMACLFGGYEFLRSAMTALFTLRFSHRSAYPLATAAVSPISIVALVLYTKLLHAKGPYVALQGSTILAAIVVFVSLIGSDASGVVLIGFLFQNMYLNVICNQQWSFCDSVIPKDSNAKKIFGRIAGISCGISTMTALAVPLVPKRNYLLSLAMISLLGSAICSHRAYWVAQSHGFDPGREQKESAKVKEAKTTGILNTIQLFRRVPILQSLLVEAISFQSLSTVLNIAFIQSISSNDEAARSSYLGRFYAACNGVSALLQFVILPCWKAPSAALWKILPLPPIIACGWWVLDTSTSRVAWALFSAKVMDYAIRSVAGNMVYQPLDFDSRFVGKEIIGVIGSRLGRSGTSLLLSFFPIPLPITGAACLIWAASSWSVSSFSAEQDQAQLRNKKDE